VTGDVVPCTDDSAMLATAARPLDLEHHRLNTLHGAASSRMAHPERQRLRSRFLGWLQRCRGVATSYLYPGWYRALGSNKRTGAQTASLRVMAIAA
jgi:hypothetical protein